MDLVYQHDDYELCSQPDVLHFLQEAELRQYLSVFVIPDKDLIGWCSPDHKCKDVRVVQHFDKLALEHGLYTLRAG